LLKFVLEYFLMHWSSPSTIGSIPSFGLRGHSATLVGSKIFIYGGYDSSSLVNSTDSMNDNHLLIFDTETMHFSKPIVTGTSKPGCLRAHTATLCGDKIYLFGGGDGQQYSGDLFVLDTNTMHWTKPEVNGSVPGPRRAHSSCLYGKKIIIFGGGDGIKAINEIYSLDIDKMLWEKLVTKGDIPSPRGYHSAVITMDKMWVYGGSDGTECFSDINMLDIEKLVWTKKKIIQSSQQNIMANFSHAMTLVGSFIFCFGGHNASEHTDELKLLNLDSRADTLEWKSFNISGKIPSPRGYATLTFHDSRIFLFGGYDAKEVFKDAHILDLGIYSLFNTPAFKKTPTH